MGTAQRQNVTISLPPSSLQKARILAARKSTSISGLLADQLERLVSEDEAYEFAHRTAIDLMTRGLKLGGGPALSRDEIHAR
jgi:hypothetical protein